MMTDLLRRTGGWIRPPGARHLRTFASLTTASQGEAALSLLGGVALIRTVGAEAAGRVFFAQSVASVWFMIWDPRLDDATQRFVPAEATGPGRGTRLFVRLLWLDVLLSLAAGVVAACGVLFAHLAGWIAAGQTVLLLLAIAGCGALAPMGTAVAGFAVIGQLARIGMLRTVIAVITFLATIAALVTAGPGGYLLAAAATGLAATAFLAVLARRAMIDALGPPPPGPVAIPTGMTRFAIKSSAAASIASASDRGVLALAGVVGGPSLVTFLKMTSAAGRLYLGFVSSVAMQIYPRMASAAVEHDMLRIRRDTLRATVLLAMLGLAVLLAAAPLAATMLTIVYGSAYASLAGAMLILLASSCIRGVVVWGKVFPMALGRPGIRLGVVTAEGVLVLSVLLTSIRLGGGAQHALLLFACGDLLIATARAATWLFLRRVLTERPSP